jgi:NAD(P)-dependent dehydrogenase (short-subunit alcohol dehydrogenase family)
MARFTDKSFVVTGGTTGIGFAAARRIVEEGGNVLVTGTSPERLRAVQASIPGAATLLNNAGDLDVSAAALAEEARRLFGTLEGVFLNAGVGTGSMGDAPSSQSYRTLVDINIGGPFFGAIMLEPLVRDGGSIVITASNAKDKGLPGSALYAATKGAARSMVRGLARDFAPRRIRVNAMSPGPIETEFFARLGRSAEEIDAMAARIATTNPLGRMGTPDEAAAVALFLLSSESSFVTGSDYLVDGGSAQL